MATQVCGPSITGARVLVAVPGSFNPPHAAHLALLRAGILAAGADAGIFVLSVRSVDKEAVSGMLLEDRLWLLCGLLQDLALEGAADLNGVGLGAAVSSRGLYVDQAAALRRLCPGAQEVVFVIGYDKIVQVLDARYYDDREATLERLFSQARFLVASRDQSSAADLEELLARPENRPYAAGVQDLVLDASLAGVSSSATRLAISAGSSAAGALPARVASFLAATGCYAAPDGQGRYGRRVAALASRHLG